MVVAAYTLGDAREKHQEQSGNTFYSKHDPMNQMIIAYFLTGFGVVLGLVQQFVVTGMEEQRQRNVLKWSSFAFFVVQIAYGVTAIVFGTYTVADGCAIFNATKICAMVTLVFGFVYSFILFIMRLRLLPMQAAKLDKSLTMV
ncbi:hypothetical protein LTR10_013345 [Elasticomyces elasticus]|uniref:Chitin synthase export chaperone n=1 Tax=Exophiala sideris TaxID=1016849 RepID=A0ABR0J655_9EURO|nr:hypothetical protein LTR10_013345 [Elasticomyces elasticus]KAK5027426.1 hypothetical protein LTS07_007028 [Exophiala sideris]KAK5034872.1 hypothetical protein LTR13_006054 [Exophiala sideris]KAK5056394.1 hypothetical protein LTR69_007935 [Exophiala sideris]KAK5181117.1 hypothetical protein LTR44_006448 [Eurotiomycetes sp. CCFEE 6388]